MIESEIVVTVPGQPAPKGSLKCIGARGGRGHVLIEDNKRTKPWRDKLAGACRRIKKPAVKGQPIGIETTLTLDRPTYHYGTGRNAKKLKDRYAAAAPVGHSTGDVDKLARLVLDALQDAKVLPDDCQVVELTVRKAYVDGNGVPDVLGFPGALLRIYPMT